MVKRGQSHLQQGNGLHYCNCNLQNFQGRLQKLFFLYVSIDSIFKCMQGFVLVCAVYVKKYSLLHRQTPYQEKCKEREETVQTFNQLGELAKAQLMNKKVTAWKLQAVEYKHSNFFHSLAWTDIFFFCFDSLGFWISDFFFFVIFILK